MPNVQINKFEDTYLAPYAMKASQTRGRVYQEDEHPYRSAYQRDRDRIIHSAAFRRLEYKTQVFVNHEGDYYRTRLTHTIEVAQIARTIAAALGLNADLTEAIALGHDLGHTPFGHSGEDALNVLMKDVGGFNHNVQGLRVVDYLEDRYPDFPGLNLTWEVREGIAKHTSAFDPHVAVRGFSQHLMPLMEMQVVDIADEIAYDNHDLDDGLTSGLLKESELEELPLWNAINRRISTKYSGLSLEKRKYLVIRSLINEQVTDLITATQERVTYYKIKSYKDIRKVDKKIVTFSKNMVQLRKPMRQFLMSKLYKHYRVIRMSVKAHRFISELYKAYTGNPEQLPTAMQKNIAVDGTRRVVCDYIAGMTDRHALDEYKKLFDPYETV